MADIISRRKFLQTGALALGTVAVSKFSDIGDVFAAQQGKSPVFFTNDISAAGLLKVYAKINQEITGKVAIKVHTGEPHGPNILPHDMVKALQQQIANSNLVPAWANCSARAASVLEAPTGNPASQPACLYPNASARSLLVLGAMP